MASIFRPVAVKPLPPSATIHTDSRGRRVARWTARGGAKVSAELTPDGTRVRVRSPVWWVQYTDHLGARRRVRGFRSREATEHLSAELTKRVADARAGRDTTSERVGPVQLIDLLPAYQEHMTRRCSDQGHVAEVIAALRDIITHAKLTTATAVDCERLAGWLDRERTRRDWAARTLNHRIARLKAFGAWLVRTHRAKFNPFAALVGSDAERDRRHVRRDLPHPDLLRLVDAARASPRVSFGLTGQERAALYLVAAFTGLRIGSLAKLTPEAIVWEGDVPAAVYSRVNKNGKPVAIPLHPDVGRELADWFRSRPPGRPLWDGTKTWPRYGSRIVQRDLAAAGIPYRNAAGEVFDFHSLRVQFGSGLARAGVPGYAAQRLMDHSDPKLTSNIYTRFGRGDLAGEIAKLPGLASIPPTPPAAPPQEPFPWVSG